MKSQESNEPGQLELTGERTIPGVPRENYWFRRHEAAYRFALRWVRGRVLDVGCGEGYGAVALSDRARVVATELDARTASYAARRYRGLLVLQADACRLPFAPGSFHTIAAMQVLEHLWCPEVFAEEVRPLLAPGGVFVLSTPNRDTFAHRGAVNPFHAHEYTLQEVHRLLSRVFHRVEVYGVRSWAFLGLLDVLAAGSLQHLLMETPWEEVPRRVRIGVRLVRADHFRLGPPEGSLDLFAVAS